MGWRVVLVSRPASLSCCRSNLVVKQEGESVTVPLEDIEALVVETQQAVVTSRLVGELASRGIAALFCDGQRLPCGVLLPFHQHYRPLKVARMQMKLTTPFVKNCWRLVVQQKLRNQGACLDLLGLGGGDKLRALAGRVRSGDSDNREAVGARVYFTALMPCSTRSASTPVNAFLNYGYSVLRGAVARALSAHGFLPFLGIHHKNELNGFNLADDFLEVFRPLVDLWVLQNLQDEMSLEPRHKQALVALLVSLMKVEEARETVLRAIDIVAGSFVAACQTRSPDRILLPQLIPHAVRERE